MARLAAADIAPGTHAHLLQLEAFPAAGTPVSPVNSDIWVRSKLKTWCHVLF
jgi:hypothetical protein